MISLASGETERWCIHLGQHLTGLPQFWGIPLSNNPFTPLPERLLFPCFCVCEFKVFSLNWETSLCLQGSFTAYNLSDAHPHAHIPAHIQGRTQSYYHHFLWRECCQTIFRSSAALENLPVAQKDSKAKMQRNYYKVQDVSGCGFSLFSVSFAYHYVNHHPNHYVSIKYFGFKLILNNSWPALNNFKNFLNTIFDL